MPYAVAGVSFGSFAVDDDSEPNRDFEENVTGLLFGIGAEYAVSSQFSVGAELVTRRFDIEFFDDANLADVESTVNNFALRGTYSFMIVHGLDNKARLGADALEPSG